MFSYPDRQFSTDALHASKRLGAWREMISDVFFNVDIDVDRTTQENWLASISVVEVQNLSISQYVTDRARGIRSRRSIAADCEEFYIFVFPIRGAMYFSQYAREGTVEPGHYVMLRSSDFYQLSCDQHFAGVFLKVPTQSIDATYDAANRHCSNWRPANQVMSKLLLSTLLTISDLSPTERTDFASSLHKQLLNMIITMLQTEEGIDHTATTAAHHGIYQRLTRLVEIRYHDENFSPAVAAAELKVSLGYMHRCVKAHGTSFSRLLRDTRLARSFEMLHEPATRRHVGEIAYLNGFSDHSGFSKIFKQRYGKTPRELRLGILVTR